jgi:trehalose/maltose hydrolase-like predicted phosphorylase
MDKMNSKRFALVIILALISVACSSTIETTKQTTEVVTQEPVTIKVPTLNVEQELKRNEEIDNSVYETYEGTKTVESTNTDGTTIKAKVTTKVRIDKKTNKPTVTAETKIETEPIETEAKIKSQKVETNSTKTTTGIGEWVKWIIIILVIIAGLTLLSYFKGWLSFLFPKKQ